VDSRPDILVSLGFQRLSVDTDTLLEAGGAFPVETLLSEPGGAFPLVTLLVELGGACPEPTPDRHSKIWWRRSVTTFCISAGSVEGFTWAKRHPHLHSPVLW
jgi:hypothetical protein